MAPGTVGRNGKAHRSYFMVKTHSLCIQKIIVQSQTSEILVHISPYMTMLKICPPVYLLLLVAVMTITHISICKHWVKVFTTFQM